VPKDFVTKIKRKRPTLYSAELQFSYTEFLYASLIAKVNKNVVLSFISAIKR